MYQFFLKLMMCLNGYVFLSGHWCLKPRKYQNVSKLIIRKWYNLSKNLWFSWLFLKIIRNILKYKNAKLYKLI